jgi:hypothetical protein
MLARRSLLTPALRRRCVNGALRVLYVVIAAVLLVAGCYAVHGLHMLLAAIP